ncbi:hypothetical protein L2E82_26795 [Cichorium intybus]|uniref:Uncharacterized protein n=1 Tax=Cichorium intybus TaxID=13427 RepID=A0ACB9CR41_CICIN|nr:hypothetical protein L2E82_26795 [Cichorium intybus]
MYCRSPSSSNARSRKSNRDSTFNRRIPDPVPRFIPASLLDTRPLVPRSSSRYTPRLPPDQDPNLTQEHPVMLLGSTLNRDHPSPVVPDSAPLQCLRVPQPTFRRSSISASR